MQSVFTAIERAATATSPVLLVGERGVGKEYLARVIHYGGPRAAAPFITAGLTGIPAGRMYPEVFGCAAQGAVPARPGLLQAASGGSLFLEEVAEATPEVQEQLAGFLEDRQSLRPGGQPDVRVFAATHRDLGQLLRNGVFREDLYYALSAVTVAVPPLRQRGDDVLLLARYFLRRIAGEEGRPVPTLSDRAIQALHEYTWPGNVRELESTLRRLVVLATGNVVDVPDLPTLMRFQAAREWLEQRSLAEVEAEHIRVVLAAVGGNQTRAAEILGIDRKTLHQKLQRD
jgi:DNA-binding NtrC family response regulator